MNPNEQFVEFYVLNKDGGTDGGNPLWRARMVNIPRKDDTVVSPPSTGVPPSIYIVNEVCWNFLQSASYYTVQVFLNEKEEPKEDDELA